MSGGNLTDKDGNPIDFAKISGLFEEMFSVFGRDRVLPLEIAPKLYRDGGAEKRPVKFERRVMCRACTKGCRACRHLGWKIASESIVVHVPVGSEIGTRLRIAGKGDERLGQVGDLEIELVEPGVRQDELTVQARERQEALTSEWKDAVIAKQKERRQRVLSGLGGGLVAIGALVAIAFMRTNRTHVVVPSFQPVEIPSLAFPTPSPPPRYDVLLEPSPASKYLGVPPPVASVMAAPSDFQTRAASSGVAMMLPGMDFDPNGSIARRIDRSSVMRGGELRAAYALPTDARGQPTRATGMPFWIRQVSTNRTPTRSAPWHEAGGKWTFLDAQFGDARVLFGMLPKPAPMPQIPSYESGELVVVPVDAASGAAFLVALGRYLHTDVPEAPSKVEPVWGRIGIFGRALHHNALTDAFEESDGPGRWTCAKLTFELAAVPSERAPAAEEETAEIYLAWDPVERLGELSEKEPDFRAPLITLFGRHAH